MKRNFSNQKTKAFTLLELLIVVAIIGVLSVAL
ncbi:MAG: prepilin-type N-terminal cleavage/methylation domain-containing protein, partial [bacterium]